MKRIVRALVAVAALLIPAAASAYPVVDPHVYVYGDKLTPSILNPPLTTLYSVLNGGIDNTNVGSAGFFASQIVPTSVGSATFGGMYGYTIAPSLASQVPLTVSAPAGQSSDILDLNLGATRPFYVDAAGTTHISSLGLSGNFVSPLIYLSTGATTGVPYVQNDTVGGIALNCATGATYCLRTLTNGVPNGFQVSSTGNLTATSATINGGLSLTSALTSSSGATFGGNVQAGSTNAYSFDGAQLQAYGGGGTPATYATSANIPAGVTTSTIGATAITATSLATSGSVTAGSMATTNFNATGSLTRGNFPVITGPVGTTRLDPTTIGVPVSVCSVASSCGSASSGYVGGPFNAVYQCQVTSTNPGVVGTIAFSPTGYTITSWAVLNQPSAITVNFYVLCIGT